MANARVQFVHAFISIVAVLLILVFVNGLLYSTGITGAFGIGTGAQSLGVETGFDSGMSELTQIETEPNMLTSLSANVKYANKIRAVVNTASSANSVLTTLPLVPWWVGDSMLILSLMGVVTLWYLISGKKV